jgi:hypothetical protein
VVECGVHQYGQRLFDVIQKRQSAFEFLYAEVDSFESYMKTIMSHDVQLHMYNYHGSTMPWLNENTIYKENGVVNVGMPHESHCLFFDNIIDIDPTGFNQSITIPRPLFERAPTKLSVDSSETVRSFVDYAEDDVPIFGSFGFGFDNKGFHKIVDIVNEQYDRAIIKLIIPMAHFDPNQLQTIQYARFKCEGRVLKPGIKLMITHEFLNTDDLLVFLGKNSMNVFMYDTMFGRGVSSTIDYAISVNRPLGISDSYMFRNIYRDDICVYKRTLSQCMQSEFIKGIDPIANNNALVLKVENILKQISKSCY